MSDNLGVAELTPIERQSIGGKKGGLSRSPAKRDAVRANLAKARLSRWPGREAAALASISLLPPLNAVTEEGSSNEK